MGDRLINARSETAAEKPSFRSAYARRRCIVPVDGFYEWRAVPGRRTKQPVYIHAPGGAPLALAGLWESWHDPTAPEDAPAVSTCAILTTDANTRLAPVHDRMPVILDEPSWGAWLDPATDAAVLAPLLVPAPDGLLTMHPVSTAVNNVRNKGVELIADLVQRPHFDARDLEREKQVLQLENALMRFERLLPHPTDPKKAK